MNVCFVAVDSFSDAGVATLCFHNNALICIRLAILADFYFHVFSRSYSQIQRVCFYGPPCTAIGFILFRLHLLPSARQHLSYGDCLEVKREYYQNCSVLGCVTQCSQSAAYSYEQFLQVQQIGFVTLEPLHHA